jgi:hypothetical protein
MWREARNRFNGFIPYARNITGRLIRGEVWVCRNLPRLSLISTWLQPGDHQKNKEQETVSNGFSRHAIRGHIA